MTCCYLDTSALVKFYIHEPGSLWLELFTSMQSGNLMVFSEVGLVEACAAFARHARTGQITTDMQKKIYAGFLHDCKVRFTLIPVSAEIVTRAAYLTQKHPLRGYDALHLACALKFNQQLRDNGSASLVFLCADNTLLQAAVAEGLTIENPNQHLEQE